MSHTYIFIRHWKEDVFNSILALNTKIAGVVEKPTQNLDLSSFDQEMIQEITLASQNSNDDISTEIRKFQNFNLIKFATCKHFYEL